VRYSNAIGGLVLSLFVLVFAGCASTPEPLPEEVIRQFDIQGNRIADLSPADSGETVRGDALLQTIADADTVDTALRIVIAAPDGDLVSAESVVDRYGGTAISYQANRTGFGGASADMSKAQLDRAIAAAAVELDIADSASAFVGVLQSEGLQPRSGTLRNLLLALLAIAALFMLWGAWTYMQARKRRQKRRAAFEERKRVLTDWAAQLAPDVESLQAPVMASADASAQQTWTESRDFVSAIVGSLGQARNAGELDAAEMRIGRVAIKLRDLRRSLGA